MKASLFKEVGYPMFLTERIKLIAKVVRDGFGRLGAGPE